MDTVVATSFLYLMFHRWITGDIFQRGRQIEVG